MTCLLSWADDVRSWPLLLSVMSYIQIVDISHEGYAISGDGVTLSGELDLLAGSFIGAGDRQGYPFAAGVRP